MSKRKKKKGSGGLEMLALTRRLLAENLRGHAFKFTIAVCCLLVIAAATASVAWLMREMANSIYVQRDSRAVLNVSIGVMVAYLAKGVASYFQTVTMGSIGASIVARLQRRQFETLMTFGMGYFSGAHPTSFMTRLQQSARAARGIIVLITTNLFRDLFTLIGLGAVMFYQDPAMSLVALIALPLAIGGVWWIVRATKRVAAQEDEIMAAVTSTGTEVIQGLRVVKAFTMEHAVNERVGESIERMEQRSNALGKIIGLTNPMMETLGGVVIGLFIIYSGWQTLAYHKSPGELMGFITAFLLAYEPAKRLANFNVQYRRYMVPVERMYNLLDRGVPEEEPRTETGQFRITKGSVRIDKLSFAYKEGQPVLQNVSFEANPGERTALVGRSGAGKSTIVNLILQMFRHGEGAILIDGQDVRTVSLADLRAGIAYVTQDTFLFSGSIRDNILFGRPDASEEEVVEAATAANALAFIKTFPEGFDTDVGDNGGRLSGGQRQRIAIARALIKDAPILLFDEATSSLDGESERAVKNAESHLMAGRTTIIVAHRLSTIQQADKIVVLDRGSVAAIGTHDSLMCDSPVYRALFSDPDVEKDL